MHIRIAFPVGTVALIGLLAVVLWPATEASADKDEAAFRREAQRQITELQARLDRLEALEQRVAVLETAQPATSQRVDELAVTVGHSPYVPRHLKAASEDTITLVSGTRVLAPGQRGKRRSLAKHLEAYDGYVMAFWATWCKPCTSPEELAHLRTLQRALHRHGVELISMAIDDLGKVQADPRAAHWLYPFWHHDDGHVEMLPQSFISGVGLGLPLFVVVSASGTMRYYRSAPLEPEVIREIVDAALDAKGR
jgi:hypothetical protein